MNIGFIVFCVFLGISAVLYLLGVFFSIKYTKAMEENCIVVKSDGSVEAINENQLYTYVTYYQMMIRDNPDYDDRMLKIYRVDNKGTIKDMTYLIKKMENSKI